MLNTIVMIIVGFEIIDFVLRSIMPKSKIDNTVNSALSMIIFAGIIILCAGLFAGDSFNMFTMDSIIFSRNVDTNDFQDYINIYKEIISNALE